MAIVVVDSLLKKMSNSTCKSNSQDHVDPLLCIVFMCLTIAHGCNMLTNNKKARFVKNEAYRFLTKICLLLWFVLSTDAFIYTTILYIVTILEIAYITLVVSLGSASITMIVAFCLYKIFNVAKKLYE